MKRLSIALLSLALVALALTGCTNPVNAPSGKVAVGSFKVFIPADSAKGLTSYDVMHVYIKAFQLGENGSNIALQNIAPAIEHPDPADYDVVTGAAVSNGRYLTELTPVFNGRETVTTPGFTRKLVGYTTQMQFSNVVDATQAIKFVAWATDFRGSPLYPDAQVNARNAWRAFRDEYQSTATLEQEAILELDALDVLSGEVDTLADAVRAIYLSSGAAIVPPYGVAIQFVPAMAALEGPGGFIEAYEAYVEILRSPEFYEWLRFHPVDPIEDNLSNPALAAKNNLDAAYNAFMVAWTTYKNGTYWPGEVGSIHTATLALKTKVLEVYDFTDFYAKLNDLAGHWRTIGGDYPTIGSSESVVVRQTQGDLTGQNVIFHAEADRFYKDLVGFSIYWTSGSFVEGNTGPAGGYVVTDFGSGNGTKSKAPSSHILRTSSGQPVLPELMFYEVSLADIGVATWYNWIHPDPLYEDKDITAVLGVANSVDYDGIDPLKKKFGTNGVTGWNLGNGYQLAGYADYLSKSGYMNGNGLAETYYWMWNDAPAIPTGYGGMKPVYDDNSVLDHAYYTDVAGMGSPATANVRPVMVWGYTKDWANNFTRPSPL